MQLHAYSFFILSMCECVHWCMTFFCSHRQHEVSQECRCFSLSSNRTALYLEDELLQCVSFQLCDYSTDKDANTIAIKTQKKHVFDYDRISVRKHGPSAWIFQPSRSTSAKRRLCIGIPTKYGRRCHAHELNTRNERHIAQNSIRNRGSLSTADSSIPNLTYVFVRSLRSWKSEQLSTSSSTQNELWYDIYSVHWTAFESATLPGSPTKCSSHAIISTLINNRF